MNDIRAEDVTILNRGEFVKFFERSFSFFFDEFIKDLLKSPRSMKFHPKYILNMFLYKKRKAKRIYPCCDNEIDLFEIADLLIIPRPRFELCHRNFPDRKLLRRRGPAFEKSRVRSLIRDASSAASPAVAMTLDKYHHFFYLSLFLSHSFFAGKLPEYRILPIIDTDRSILAGYIVAPCSIN